ncbi:MAG: hypothetical protein JOZ16_01555 [Methylobacteriaceae bacterium]|nr:hypothetical protein [Methylobacteriaceae bacterium]
MKRFTALAITALAIGSVGAEAAPPKPSGKSEAGAPLVYTVTRDGSPIGRTTVDIDRSGDTTTVTSKTDIEVKVIIVLYRFKQDVTETWKGDQLVSFKSVTDDNGTPHDLSITSAGKAGLTIVADGKTSTAPAGAIPASFWSTRFVKAKTLIHPDNGRLITVSVKDIGPDDVNVGGAPRKAEHYKVSAGKDYDRDLWYDGEQLVRVRIKDTSTQGNLIGSDLQ